MATRPHRLLWTAGMAMIATGVAVALVLFNLPSGEPPPPAHGAFHLMHMNEVMSGAGGDPNIQYVEMRIDTTFQDQVAGAKLTVFKSDGTHTVLLTLPNNLPSPSLIRRWVMASPSAAAFMTASGINPDYTFPGGLPTSNAMVCWGKPFPETDPASYVDCVAYGGYTGGGAAADIPAFADVSASNAGDGTLSLTRIADTAGQGDFALRCPTPENFNQNVGNFGPCTNPATPTPTPTATATATPTNTPNPSTDSDLDGMPNAYENQHPCLNPNLADANGDPDGDGRTSIQEMAAGTKPCDSDSDDDGLSDGVETDTGTYISASNTGTDPLLADTDEDELLDGVETATGTFVSPSNTGTHPIDRDTDGGTATDGLEVGLSADPFNPADDAPLLTPDSDADGCNNGKETGTDQIAGGRRNPFNFYDWYDVTGDKFIDLGDTLKVLQHFGHGPAQDATDDSLDRSIPDQTRRWRLMASDSGVDLGDALNNLQSFGHDCS